MKRIKAVLMMLAGLAVLCLVIGIGYTGVTSEVKAAPPEDEPQPTLDLQDFPLFEAVPPNDYCSNAEALTPWMVLTPPGGTPPPPPSSYSVTAADRKFNGGSNVDDWYVYSTHDLDCSFHNMLTIELVSDRPQLELELYEYCFQWPIMTSMYKEYPGIEIDGVPGETVYEPLSGLGKTITIYDALPNHEYYIHVNCLGAPEGGPITYTLEVEEWCYQPPR